MAWLPAAVSLTFLVLALLLSVTLSGCGEEETVSSDTILDTGVSLEEGLADAAVGAALLSRDIPDAAGTVLVMAASEPREPVSVDFSLSGPWDFSSGPSETRLRITIMEAGDAHDADEFPDAAYALEYSWSPGVEPDEYIYLALDESSLKVFGRSGARDGILRLEGASRALLFPLSPGDAWVDSYIETRDGETTEVTADNRVIAFDELTVPAGTFDAFLVQTRITAAGGDEAAGLIYTWYVPGVGKAAEIVSMPGEPSEVFSRASAFYRLEDFENA